MHKAHLGLDSQNPSKQEEQNTCEQGNFFGSVYNSKHIGHLES